MEGALERVEEGSEERPGKKDGEWAGKGPTGRARSRATEEFVKKPGKNAVERARERARDIGRERAGEGARVRAGERATEMTMKRDVEGQGEGQIGSQGKARERAEEDAG
jgi:hypothetical protein